MNKRKILTLLLLSFILSGFSQESTKSDNQEHQFDFWIGEWNVYKFGTDTIIGVSSIKPILNHKTIEENYQALEYTYKGKSLNIYNRKNQMWEQFWVDNSGMRLHMKGKYENGKMILSDCPIPETCNRITWTELGDKTVRQEWEQSNDEGKTWKKGFDGHYKLRQ
jgi:hypothetical protein